jgi:pimeloyl-ACP methyl ester carboxylesterase
MPQVDVDGLTIHYEQRGAGPRLVLLHGIGGNTELWRYQLEGLSDSFTVTAWDTPGYGRSDDPDRTDWEMADYAGRLAGLLDQLGIERAHIMGQSWGGILAQEFYRHYPQRVRSLILSDTSAGGGAQPAREREAALQARLTASDTMTPAEMARQRAPVLLTDGAPASLVAEVEAVLAEIHPVGYRMAAIASANADTRDVLPTVSVPTLVIAAEHDRVVPPERARELHAAVPGSQLVIIGQAGHLPCVEQPETYNAAVRAFLMSVA